ncbi:unnamed protein product, partial [Prorocentrum cordatum]
GVVSLVFHVGPAWPRQLEAELSAELEAARVDFHWGDGVSFTDSAVAGRGSAAGVHYGAGGLDGRLVGSLVECGELAAVSPDFDVREVELSLNNGGLEGIRFSCSVDVWPRGVPALDSVLYTFAPLMPARVDELSAEADQVINLERAHRGFPLEGEAARAPGAIAVEGTPVPAMGPAPGATRFAPTGGVWVVAEPLGGHDIGEESPLPAEAVGLRSRGLEEIDGGVAVLEQLSVGADLTRWGLAQSSSLCDDPSILARSPTERTLVDAARPLTACPWEEDAVLRGAVLLVAAVDGVNVKNLIDGELLLRLIPEHGEAAAGNLESQGYEVSDCYLGIDERSGGAQTVSSLWAHAATELSVEAVILKEKRKASEARGAGVTVVTAKRPGTGTGRKARLHFKRWNAVQSAAQEAVDGLNLLFGCDPQELLVPTQRDGAEAVGGCSPVHSAIHQHLFSTIASGMPDHVQSDHASFRELAGVNADYEMLACAVEPYDPTKVSLPEGQVSPVVLTDLVSPELGRSLDLDNVLADADVAEHRLRHEPVGSYTDARIRGGSISGKTLERLLGHYVVEALNQRPALSVLRASYVFIRDCYWTPRPLWDPVCRELLVCSSQAPLPSGNFGRPWSTSVLATDASGSGWGVMEAGFDSKEVKEIGGWNERWRYERLPPLGYRLEEPIGNREGRAVIKGMSLKLLGPCQHHKRHLVLVDNFGVSLCFSGGRAASAGLLQLVRRLAALSIAAGAWVALRWIPSEYNPADEPPRLFEKLKEARARLYEVPAVGAELDGPPSSSRAIDFLRGRRGPTGGRARGPLRQRLGRQAANGELGACEPATVGVSGLAAYQCFENMSREWRRHRGRTTDNLDAIEVSLLDYLKELLAVNVKLKHAEKTGCGLLRSTLSAEVRPLPSGVKSGICARLVYDGAWSTAVHSRERWEGRRAPGSVTSHGAPELASVLCPGAGQ